MICHDCGGSNSKEAGTRVCVCNYGEPHPSHRKLTYEERARRLQILTYGCDGYDDDTEAHAATGPPYEIQQAHKVCQFCGSNLFTPPGSDLRMCLPCAIELDHEDCIRCVRCNKTWLVDGGGCVCAQYSQGQSKEFDFTILGKGYKKWKAMDNL